MPAASRHGKLDFQWTSGMMKLAMGPPKPIATGIPQASMPKLWARASTAASAQAPAIRRA